MKEAPCEFFLRRCAFHSRLHGCHWRAHCLLHGGFGRRLSPCAGQDLALSSEQFIQSVYDSFVLLAVPLFIIAANIMNVGAISDRLLEFCKAIVGRFKGGMAQVDILVSLIFSGMSGSAVADAAGVGKVSIRMMLKTGHYTPGYAAAVVQPRQPSARSFRHPFPWCSLHSFPIPRLAISSLAASFQAC